MSTIDRPQMGNIDIKHAAEAELRAHYDERLSYYSPLDSNSVPWLFRQLAPEVGDGVTLLDIGCGDGRLATAWQQLRPAASYIGVDYSTPRIQQARRTRPGTFVCADVNLYTPPTHHTYLVAMFEVLEHLQDPLSVVERYQAYGPVIGSVPLQMEYKAHLHVYESVQDVEERLGVQVLESSARHAFFRAPMTA